jgi:hypothetical protein
MLAERFTTDEGHSKCQAVRPIRANVVIRIAPNSNDSKHLGTMTHALQPNTCRATLCSRVLRHASCMLRACLRKDLRCACSLTDLAGNFALYFTTQLIVWKLMLKRFFSNLQRQPDYDGISIRQSQVRSLMMGHLRSPPDSLLTDAQPLPSPQTR